MDFIDRNNSPFLRKAVYLELSTKHNQFLNYEKEEMKDSY